MTEFAINARFRAGPQTGVQRVADQLARHMALRPVEIAPSSWGTGIRGHAWEQLALPLRLGGQPLWSPCNTGPVLVRDQVVTLHDAAVFDHPEWFSRSFVATYRALWPLLARRARRIVTVSDYSQTRLAGALGIAAARIEVVPNGVSTAFRPLPTADAAGRIDRFGIEPGRYVATVCTIEPRKNLALVLAGWAIARGRLPGDIRLVVIGGGGAAHIFAGAVAVEGEGVVRTGFVADEELVALIGGACALLYPSRYEGFGLPVLEAMACGTPAVTTRATSLPEVGGDVAVYVDPDDAGAMAREIVSFVGDPARRADLGAAGIARAAGFGWPAAASRMEDVLRRAFAL